MTDEHSFYEAYKHVNLDFPHKIENKCINTAQNYILDFCVNILKTL